MTATEAVPTTESVSGKNAVYYVVPVVLKDGSDTRSAFYFNPETIDGYWQIVGAKDLRAKGRGNTASKVTLRQPSASEIADFANLQDANYDPTLTLYAGVAKTLGKRTGVEVADSLPSLFPVAQDGTMTIPVGAESTRGLILVFSKSATVDGDVTELMSMTEPEIKNSTGDPETGNSTGG